MFPCENAGLEDARLSLEKFVSWVKNGRKTFSKLDHLQTFG